MLCCCFFHTSRQSERKHPCVCVCLCVCVSVCLCVCVCLCVFDLHSLHMSVGLLFMLGFLHLFLYLTPRWSDGEAPESEGGAAAAARARAEEEKVRQRVVTRWCMPCCLGCQPSSWRKYAHTHTHTRTRARTHTHTHTHTHTSMRCRKEERLRRQKEKEEIAQKRLEKEMK